MDFSAKLFRVRICFGELGSGRRGGAGEYLHWGAGSAMGGAARTGAEGKYSHRGEPGKSPSTPEPVLDLCSSKSYDGSSLLTDASALRVFSISSASCFSAGRASLYSLAWPFLATLPFCERGPCVHRTGWKSGGRVGELTTPRARLPLRRRRGLRHSSRRVGVRNATKQGGTDERAIGQTPADLSRTRWVTHRRTLIRQTASDELAKPERIPAFT